MIQLNSKRGVQAENARLDTNMRGDLNKSYCVRGCSLDCHLQARTAGAGAGCRVEAEAAGTQLSGEHRGREAPEAIAGHAPSPPSHLSTRRGPRTQPCPPFLPDEVWPRLTYQLRGSSSGRPPTPPPGPLSHLSSLETRVTPDPRASGSTHGWRACSGGGTALWGHRCRVRARFVQSHVGV